MLHVPRSSPISLLDNAPLARMLRANLDLGRIQRNIDSGTLYAVSITRFGYASEQSVSFLQGGSGAMEWKRTQRAGCAAALRIKHLMASSALPFIFQAVKIDREYFGDGSMRQIAPLSPALHLGADRLLVMGSAGKNPDLPRVRSDAYPYLALHATFCSRGGLPRAD